MATKNQGDNRQVHLEKMTAKTEIVWMYRPIHRPVSKGQRSR